MIMELMSITTEVKFLELEQQTDFNFVILAQKRSAHSDPASHVMPLLSASFVLFHIIPTTLSLPTRLRKHNFLL